MGEEMNQELLDLLAMVSKFKNTYGFYYEGTYIHLDDLIEQLDEIYMGSGGWNKKIKEK